MTRTTVVLITALLTALTAPVLVGAQDVARTDGWVVLSVDPYRALRAKAFPAPPDPAAPPVDAALTRVDYDLRVAGGTVIGEVRLTIDVLKQGWVSVQVGVDQPPAFGCGLGLLG